MEPAEAGRLLAERHAQAAKNGAEGDYDFDASLLNYAEFPYEGDWTLRSALVRLAQPEPARVGALLEVVRRLDAPLHHAKRALERVTVTCDRALISQAVASQDLTATDLAGAAVEPYQDIRTADLARLAAEGFDQADLFAGYDEGCQPEQDPLGPEERVAVPLLVVALDFAGLSAELAGWALTGPGSPPVESVDHVVAKAKQQLDDLGVPIETGPPPGTGRSRGT